MVLSASGCTKLDTAPYDRISSETFYKTPEHAKQAVMGIYGGLRRDDAFGKKYMHDNMGVLSWGFQENGFLSFMIGTANERTAHAHNYWRHMYDGVQRSNQVIRRVSEMEVADNVKKPVVGEARFLRALHYL
ncbi:MAG: RagB/SusD family nutrient uptake outer membrane protein, partial [Sphingobacteriales bacterium]